MRLVVGPGATLEGSVRVPGDKSIAHRWLMLAATARGTTLLRELPPSLDVRSTASCLAGLVPKARDALDGWALNAARGAERNGFTWDADSARGPTVELEVEGKGRSGLVEAGHALDCGNSGTTMRLLAGMLASAPFASSLTGDASLRARPMERVAAPLRQMGADVRTTRGHAPLEVRGAALRGISYRSSVPSAQLKSAVLLAGLAAAGPTEVQEPAPTRDHTERALRALGAPIAAIPRGVRLSAFQHDGFEGTVPGDVSSAAFLLGAAAVTGGRVRIDGVGLNPTRTRVLDVLRRMGVEIRAVEQGEELGEPVGSIEAHGPTELTPTTVEPDELPLVIDEVPVLAAVAAHARGDSWFAGASELRVKESDRLDGLAAALRDIGSTAAVEGDDLVVAGGALRGGSVDARGDHRMAMAMTVAALGADGVVEIEGAEAADVSFPGFASGLRRLGARVEVRP
jgi:3-phosphoshikimate 1-carboxyvinyltransferase